MSDVQFNLNDKVLTWDDGWYVEEGEEDTLVQNPATDLAWVLEAPFETLMQGIWEQKDEFPFEEVAIAALRKSNRAARAAVWVHEALNHHGGRDLMTWAITQELGEAAHDPDLDESTRKIAEGVYQGIVAPQVGRMSKEDMKEFVLGVVDGRIYTSAHCRQENILGMVFMPLALGAFSTPKYALPPEPKKPEPPEDPAKMPYPEKPEKGDPPVKPEELQVEAAEVERLEFEIRWHRKQPDSVDKYKASVAEKNDMLRKEYDQALKAHETAHEADLEAWRARCREIDAEHEEALQKHKEVITHWEDNHDEAIQEHKAWEELREKQSMAYLNQIGVLWEWLDKAGPRSINGQPIFFSMHVMHIKDWKKCWKAIEAEYKRREALDDMFEDDEDEDEVPT